MLDWLIERIDHEVWNREYKEMFSNPEGYARQQKATERIKPTGPDKRGHLNIERKRVDPSEVDLSEVLGKYGKPAARKDDAGGITIGPDPDGNLSVSGPEPDQG